MLAQQARVETAQVRLKGGGREPASQDTGQGRPVS